MNTASTLAAVRNNLVFVLFMLPPLRFCPSWVYCIAMRDGAQGLQGNTGARRESDGHAGFRANIDQSERTGTQGCVERASSRQRRLSSRRVFVADSKDMPPRKRALPPGRPLHASQPMSGQSTDAH